MSLRHHFAVAICLVSLCQSAAADDFSSLLKRQQPTEDDPLGQNVQWIRDEDADGKPVVAAIARFANSKSIQELSQHQSLKAVLIRAAETPAPKLNVLKDLKELKAVYLDGNMVTDGNLKMLQELGLLFSSEAGEKEQRQRPIAEKSTSIIFNVPRYTYQFPIHADVTDLSLHGTALTNVGLRELHGLPSGLRTLYINRDKVNDETLGILRELGLLHKSEYALTKDRGRPATVEDVATFNLWNIKVTSASLRELKDFNNLQTINLSKERQITDDFLQVLGEMNLLHTLAGASCEQGRPAGAAQVTHLRLSGSPVTDEGLQEFAGFTNLQSLDLNATRVTDAGLKVLNNFPRLQQLYLETSGTGITGAGFRDLAAAHELETLDLWATPITDDALKEIARFRSLKVLNLTSCKITDAGLKHLAPLVNLEKLLIWYTDISDDGLKHILAFDKLKTLAIAGPKITAGGLRPLQEMPVLEQFSVGYATDEFLGELEQFQHLKILRLDRPKVSEAGFQQFKAARPDVQINR